MGTPDPPLPYAAEPAFPRLVFDRPVVLAQPPGARELVVAALGGKVYSFADDPQVERAALALDLATRRPRFGSLYGLAFHPRFAENRQVFVCYTERGDTPAGTRVSRFRALAIDPLRIDIDSEEVVLTFPSGGHNGGCLAFGPEGCLYISTGDAAAPTPPDPLLTGQDLSDLLSSILRIDVDRRDPGRAYHVPEDNPFVTLAGARPEVWAYGFRNPWRMSFDPSTGSLWVGDVGWEQWELIFRVERGGNYGWSVREGRQPVRPDGPFGPTPIVPPVVDHPHSEAASITGGYVYRGNRLENLVGTYVYGDYQSGRVWGLKHDGQRLLWRGPLAETGLRLVSFGTSSAGELYLLELERSNQVYRLVPNPAPAGGGEFPRTLSETGLFSSARNQTPAAGVVPYRINVAMWSDGACAERFLAIPGDGRIEIERDGSGAWRLPEGSVLARTVSFDTGGAGGAAPRMQRVETQVLHRQGGAWRPYTYVWNDDQSDATLAAPEGTIRTLSIRDDGAPGGGGRSRLLYRVAARTECGLCHNPWVEARTTIFGVQSASPLAMSLAQLDCDGRESPGPENQLDRLDRLGYFAAPLPSRERRLPRLVDPSDAAADLDTRARSYLQVNCAHCHLQGGGGSAEISLEAALPLARTRTVNARPLQGTFGIDDARIIAPGEPERSVLYYRIAKLGAGRMPRLGSQRVDTRSTRLIADWIAHLPGDGDGDGAPPRAAAGDPPHGLDLQAPAVHADEIRRATGSTRGALGLLRLIDQGKVAPATLETIVAETRGHSRAEVRDLFERFVPENERVARLGDVIDPLTILSLQGDPGRGRDAFFSESATQCKSCHRIGGAGVELGPDLDAIGSRYSRTELLGHILEPSRTVDPRYAVQVVATTDGQVHQGLLGESTPGELVLRNAQNQAVRIPRPQIERQSTVPASLMPAGLLRDLTAQQAADLLAYLCSLKGR